jgi:hypothetical protein
VSTHIGSDESRSLEQRSGRFVGAVNEFGSELDRQRPTPLPERVDSAAQTIARVDDRDPETLRAQTTRGAQAGNAGADNQDVAGGAGECSSRHGKLGKRCASK